MNKESSRTTIFMGEVLPDDSPILHGLPSGIDPIRFRNSLATAVMLNPQLLKVHSSLVMREVSRAANLGLSLDPTLGEAYLVIRKNRVANRDEPQLQIGWRGLIRLARQSGDIVHAHSFAVHEYDQFSISLGVDLKLEHRPDVFGERGYVIGYYAVMRFGDGSYDFEAMSLLEVESVRDRSDGWRAFRAGRIKHTPWSEWPDEMGRKTVLRRLLKRAPMSADALRVLRSEDESDDGSSPRIGRRITVPELPKPRRGRLPKQQPTQGPEAEIEDQTDEEMQGEEETLTDEQQAVADKVRDDIAAERKHQTAHDLHPPAAEKKPAKRALDDDENKMIDRAYEDDKVPDIVNQPEQDQPTLADPEDDDWPGPRSPRGRRRATRE